MTKDWYFTIGFHFVSLHMFMVVFKMMILF